MSPVHYEVRIYKNTVPVIDWELGTGLLEISTYLSPVVITDVTSYILTDWSRMSFTQKINDFWYHNISFETTRGSVTTDLLRNTIGVDWIVEVYRKDLISGDKDKVYEGLNQTVVDQMKNDGTFLFNLYGQGHTSLLKRRVIKPADDADTFTMTDNGETIIKTLVNDQVVSPTDTDRTIRGMIVEADQGEGETITFSARNTNLLSGIKKIALESRVDFGVVVTSIPGILELQVRPTWGSKRFINNADGNPAVIFNISNANMNIPILSNNHSDEKNVVYVGGAGQGSDRTIIEVEDELATDDSDWNRREAFVNKGNVSDVAELSNIGSEYLEDHAATQTLTFNVSQEGPNRWLRDWVLGDVVSAVYFGNIFLKKIAEISVNVTRPGEAHHETVTAEMVDVPAEWLLEVTGFSELEETTVLSGG